MKRQVALCLFLSTLLRPAVGVVTEMYVAEGKPLTLRPPPRDSGGPIRSLEWKRGPNLFAEWDGAGAGAGAGTGTSVVYYDERITLDVKNGELLIENPTAAHTGVFTLSLNGEKLDDSFNVKVIRYVPKPEVHSSPLACTADKLDLNNCTLHCGGNTGGAEPVTYFWITEPGGEIRGGRNRSIDRTNSALKSFFCIMENPLGREQSQPFSNPFYQDKPAPILGPAEIGGVVAAGVVVSVLLTLLGYWLYRKNRGDGATGESNGVVLETTQPLRSDK
ncbi:uncharacterized protein LOC144061095 [Vanacampus margaritifer]